MPSFPIRRFARSLALAAALAAPHAHATLTINAPWVRAGTGAAAEAYMELRSSEGAALVGVTSGMVGRITIRPPGKDRPTLPELALPAGEALKLAPGGYRLALARIAHPLKLGDFVPLTLTIRNADGTLQEIAIRAEVRRRSAIDDHLDPLHPHAH